MKKSVTDVGSDVIGALIILAVAASIVVGIRVYPSLREFLLAAGPWLLAVTALWIGGIYFRSRVLPQWNKSTQERAAEEERGKVALREQAARIREAEIAKYRQLRNEIERMPEYERWRNAVLEKYGRKCAVCGSAENIEVDHRYRSFYAIVQLYQIENIVQAYECQALWDVNNGAPVCKKHHDQTRSSRFHIADAVASQ
ncbi:MAG: hypothetical protein UW55_C0010G0017 [Candidatus Giovannonibacteria bacterium GW2011_GWA2_44_26]|uniref:Uncharacterized protein n=1 Tax=Candidatus Giovannonibacteria bacterium GW2011_GWA2_44_26 TaxID=1618648 RepID=A0A0G1IUN1_9BACT|nr:MAG: hypothetical protein UW55_C0010G0017 [Candidatus Giovannonibacteria bacterium GW2011_GWA2_44_26]